MLREAMYTTIKTLRNQELNKSEISRLTGHDWKTVSKVIGAIESGEDAPKKKPHPRILDDHQEQLIEWIEAGLSAVRMHEKLRAVGVAVGYTTVKSTVAQIKGSKAVFIRVHTLPGEEAQVDFGYAGYTRDDTGKRRKTWVFNMRLSYSRLDYYETVYDQTVETFIRCHIHAFEYFNGVPAVVKIDNLKAAILEANFYEPVYQRLYQQFAKHYGFDSVPCRVYRPNDKGKVESGIQYVKGNFFKGRQFHSETDLKQRLRKWQEKANRRLHGTTRKVPAEVFAKEESKKLLKLPDQPFPLTKVGTRKVYHDCHVYIQYNYYSVPFEYVGKEVEICVDEKLVNIYYATELIASHIRLTGRGEFRTCKGHYPRYKCQSPSELQERYQGKMAKIGHYAEQMCLALIREQQRSWYRPVQGILSLVKSHPPEVVNLACQRALAYQALGYQRVKRICNNGSYLLPLDMNHALSWEASYATSH